MFGLSADKTFSAIAGGERKETMSDAWRCAGIGRDKRKSKCAETWTIQARNSRGTPPTARFSAAIANTDSTDQVITTQLEPSQLWATVSFNLLITCWHLSQ
jgi:hypothetical protein